MNVLLAATVDDGRAWIRANMVGRWVIATPRNYSTVLRGMRIDHLASTDLARQHPEHEKMRGCAGIRINPAGLYQ